MQAQEQKMTILKKIAPYSADVMDPFVLKRALPFSKMVKALILTITLLPLRIVLMLLTLSLAWFLAKTTIQGLPEDQRTRKKPLTGWRRLWMKPVIVALVRLVFTIAGFHWLPTRGQRASAKEAPILCLVPHTSFWDTVAVVSLGCPILVVKDSLEHSPFFGDLINYTQPVYVQRDSSSSRQHTIEEMRRRCNSGDDWEQILIFPEGTCSNGKALLDFKLGAFFPGVPIQPVFIRYPNKLDTVTWTWDGPGTLEQTWLSLCQFHVFCELEFLPVYYPSAVERENPQMYAENFRLRISKMCNIPVSCFAVDDLKYLNLAKTQSLPKTVPLIKLLKLRKRIGKEQVEVKIELSKLTQKLALMADTMCTVEEFGKYIGSRVADATKEFFHLMDQENKGKIDVRVYNVGLWILRTNLSEWKRLENGFKIFDVNGMINGEQFAAIAFLWRGLPLKVTNDIFQVLNFESKQNKISFKTFKSIATSYVQLERTMYSKPQAAQNGSPRKRCSSKSQTSVH